jgi:hypothetical protein
VQLAALAPINLRIQEIQSKIAQEVARRSLNKDLSSILSVKALQNIADRLEKIREILNIQRYNLVFIGQVGAGKTTAICHLFNLVRAVEDWKNPEKPAVKFKELLSTGAGKTTICEVVIRRSDRTWVEIDPYEETELKQLITEFGLWIWQKTHPAAIKEKVEIPPDELLRAIRNIVALPEEMVNSKIHDHALEFAKGFTNDQYTSFQTALIERGYLSDRNETLLYPEESGLLDQRKWLSDVFQDLNVAKLLNFSIPKRIYINLEPQLLDLSNHDRFGSIIDTRGLDIATKDRRDLAHYIREKDNAICIFTERFPSAPANALPIISKYLTSEAKDINTKFALLVMPRKGEPEKVLGADGQAVDDLDEGIALRKVNINNVFSNEEVNFLGRNILFYDALRCYLGDGRIDRNYEETDRDIDRQQILANINQIITEREQSLMTELGVLADQFQRIASSNSFTEIENQLVTYARQEISQFQDLSTGHSSFSQNYVEMLPDHHGTLRATNNRYGRYELRGIDIYFNSRYLAEQLTRQITQTGKMKIGQIIDAVEAEISSDSALYPVMQRLRNQIDQHYEAVAIDLSNMVEALLKDRVLAPQDYDDCIFWQNAIDRWGQGTGYKADVLKMYSEQIVTVDRLFAELIQTDWRNRIVQPIMDFLGAATLSSPVPLFQASGGNQN